MGAFKSLLCLQDLHTPSKCGWLTLARAELTLALAVILWSGPAASWSSLMASMSAMRALAFASRNTLSLPEDLLSTVAMLRIPNETTAINERIMMVEIKAKPLLIDGRVIIFLINEC